ncbi:2-succinyl-6-hydroxy-2,4-cyclohexadiene-1-carboxylate synthase [Sporosarcina siberiensis]|uniref:Putative 2-succinyl-6-hydroxy-2,4-cyclohexadiene-1-carboxylate synthase n=1 Tax=Sporosarcina siberiensis TaxID=1365606 RepID=A0ABW4SGC8_9BACL
MVERLINVRETDIYVKINGDTSLPVLVFLHGFTGSVETWSEVVQIFESKFKIIRIDLTGHGKSSIPKNEQRYTMEEQVEDLEAVFNELGLTEFVLIGYSMGGRIALAYTVKYSERVLSLILESASPGLRTKQERSERRLADKALAERLTSDGLLKFVDFWENIPLFKSQKLLSTKKQKAIREERLRQSTIGLSNSLIGIGTGSQPSYWESLQTVQIPVFLITGEIDKKFVLIAREMEKTFPIVKHTTIKSAGHAIHVEKPTLFATMIEEHITELKK